MDLTQMLEFALRVIADWRVIFITVAVLLAIALLRYVGLVYHKAPKRKARPKSSGPGAAAAGGGPASAKAGAQAQSEESGSDLSE
jgi:hypothetical protein